LTVDQSIREKTPTEREADRRAEEQLAEAQCQDTYALQHLVQEEEA
jgi:hypothetical protein